MAKVTVKFVNMGQGDCTVIITPDRKWMMIDCGTTKWDGEREERLVEIRKDVFGTKRPHVMSRLILTHNDDDHYNVVGSVLGQITVDTVYYSGRLDTYFLGDFNEWLYNGPRFSEGRGLAARQILPVTVNNDYSDIEQIYPRRGDNADGFTLIVLASNVGWADAPPTGTKNPQSDTAPSSDSVATNTRSIVVRGEFENFSFIITGDATVATQKFIVDNSPASDLQVSILRTPHHGGSASLGDDFVAKTKPNDAIFSSSDPQRASRPLYPRLSQVNKFLKGVPGYTGTATSAANHLIAYAVDVDEDGDPLKGRGDLQADTLKTTEQICVTGVNGTITYVFDSTLGYYTATYPYGKST